MRARRRRETRAKLSSATGLTTQPVGATASTASATVRRLGGMRIEPSPSRRRGSQTTNGRSAPRIRRCRAYATGTKSDAPRSAIGIPRATAVINPSTRSPTWTDRASDEPRRRWQKTRSSRSRSAMSSLPSVGQVIGTSDGRSRPLARTATASLRSGISDEPARISGEEGSCVSTTSASCPSRSALRHADAPLVDRCRQDEPADVPRRSPRACVHVPGRRTGRVGGGPATRGPRRHDAGSDESCRRPRETRMYPS